MTGIRPGRKSCGSEHCSDLGSTGEVGRVDREVRIGGHQRHIEIGLASVVVDRLGADEDQAAEVTLECGESIEQDAARRRTQVRRRSSHSFHA